MLLVDKFCIVDNGQSGDVASDGMVTQPNSVDSLRNAEVVVTRTEASLPNQESIVLNEDYVELIKGQPEPINSVGDMTNIPFVKYSDKNVVKDSINACEKHSSKRRKMLIIGEKIVPELQVQQLLFHNSSLLWMILSFFTFLLIAYRDSLSIFRHTHTHKAMATTSLCPSPLLLSILVLIYFLAFYRFFIQRENH